MEGSELLKVTELDRIQLYCLIDQGLSPVRGQGQRKD